MPNAYSSFYSPWLRRGLGALALVANTAQAQTATFTTAATYRTGDTPQGIALADVNGDGRPDVINANTDSGNVGVLLNSATTPGTFPATATFYSSRGASPIGLGVGDVNGDGRPDVVVTNQSSGTVGVLLNSSAAPGTFLAGSLYDTGFSTNFNNPRGVILGDVNGDGRLDIVVGNQSASTVSVLLNSATTPGTFSAAKLYPTSAPSDAIALGDVDGDGRLDLVISSGSSGTPAVSVLLNSATTPGTFLPVVAYQSGAIPRGVTLGDVNGDGRLDIVTANEQSNDIGVLLNSPTVPGTFGPVALYPSGAPGPSSVMVADLTGDGRLDIATANYKGSRGSTVSVLVNSAASPGTFLSATTYSSGGEGPHDIALADVNGDGKPDITMTNLASSTVGVLRNTTMPVPTLTSLNPTRGPVGTTVVLTGTNLGGATSVSFNGQAASFAVNSATTITATVPAGATPGPVTVTTASGATGGILFTVTYPDLVVSTTITIPAGTYNSIAVTSTGTGTLAGNVTVNTSTLIASGGTLHDGCSVLSGTGSFTLAPGGTLSICAAQGITSSGASGAVQVTGKRSFSPDASYVYNGRVAQVTGDGLPGQVRNLSTTNATTVTLSAPTAIGQVLTVGSAGDLVTGGNPLTLLSSAAGTALVVNSSTGVVSGNATVQRYIDGSLNQGAGYRHYSAPVGNSTVADLATSGFIPVVNPAYNTSATPGQITPFPTVYAYDQNRLATVSNNQSAFDKGWVSPASLGSTLLPGFGYTVNIDAGQVVDFVGSLNNLTTTVPVGRTSGATAADAGWALLGNPYPAPLDLSLVDAADHPNLDAATYVIQSTGQYAGGYRAYVNGISTSATNSPLLAVGQGFFVRVSAGQTTGSFTFRNAQRVTTYASQAAFQRPAADGRPTVRLELAGAGRADAWVAYAEAGATAEFDGAFDAGKLPNTTGLNLSSVAGVTNVAIDGRAAFTTATTLALVVGVPATGTYTLAATALSNLPTGLTAYLHDTQTEQTTKLAIGTSYPFRVSTAEAQALVQGRFTLVFRPQTALATTPALSAEAVSVYPNPAHGSFVVALPSKSGGGVVQAELVNTLGQVVRRQSAPLPASGTTFHVPTAELAAGVYLLRLRTGDTTLTKRVVVQ